MAIFQRVMEEELNECPGSGAFIDDVICTGENDEVHEQNVDRVLHQLNERGFKLKPQKFVYMADKITYRGHEITANGVSPSPDKVNSLKEATPPSNALTNVPPSDSEKVTVQVLLVESGEIVRAETVRTETANDPILAQVLRFVRNGWPMEVSEELKPFYSRRTELTIEDEILLWNERVVIPMSLRLILLNDLHAEHFGMTKMKQMARRYLWWPNVDHDIECTVKSCVRCQEQAKNPAKKTGTWTWSNGPWKRLHIDFAGPFMGKMFLVVVDAYSKYLDVVPMDHATSATTIKALRHIFSIFGLPEHIVTDNGSQFSSQEFKNWLTQNGIIHTLTAPGHPATNGLAERYVGLFKSKMKEVGQTGESIQERIDRFLLAYRTTPTSIGRSASELLTNRQPRIRYNALRASTTKQQVRMFEDSSKETPSYQVGDAVFALNFGRGPRWSAGTVLHINSPFSYDIQVEGNLVWKRHRDQLRQRTIAATDYSSRLDEGNAQGTRRPSITQSEQSITQSEQEQDSTVNTAPVSSPSREIQEQPNREQTEQIPADGTDATREPEVSAGGDVRRSSRTSRRPDRLIEHMS